MCIRTFEKYDRNNTETKNSKRKEGSEFYKN